MCLSVYRDILLLFRLIYIFVFIYFSRNGFKKMAKTQFSVGTKAIPIADVIHEGIVWILTLISVKGDNVNNVPDSKLGFRPS